jgi:hypothetical protein
MSKDVEAEYRLTYDAVQAGIDAASDAVSELPAGQRAWGQKEYRIAEIAARHAIAALRRMERDDWIPQP